VVLIDDIDTLIRVNGFDRVFQFIGTLIKAARSTNSCLIIQGENPGKLKQDMNCIISTNKT